MYTQISRQENDEDFIMAALVMQVNGFKFLGKVYIVSSYATRHCNQQLHSTIAYYKILQYLCFTQTLGRPNPDYNENPKIHIKHGNDKQKA